MPIPESSVRLAFARELAMPFLEEITLAPKPSAIRGRLEAMDAGDLEPRRGKASIQYKKTVDTSERSLLLRIRELLSRASGRDARAPQEITTETAEAPLPAAPSVGEPASLAGDLMSRPMLGGRYVLLEELGRGGMAVVYLSWDIVLRRVVAIKVLRPDGTDPHSLQREAAAALELTHEGIVRLYHFEPADGRKDGYLVMEYVSWPSGEKWIANAGDFRLPIRPILDVGVRLCDALAHAHSRNVLHLDIKPSNIFVDPGGENAKIGDFGLAQVVTASQLGMQLRPAGTPAYMAPEQVAPGARVSPATDVYQLAATLWDLLTGKPPSRGDETIPRFDSARNGLLSILHPALVPDPASRPPIGRLREMLAAAR